MEIAPNIHRIPCRFGGTRISFVHLFVGTEAAMLVDTCCAHNPEQDILPYMARIGLAVEQLKYIVISHSDLDHQGGNAPMKAAAPHALILCHALDRPWIESTEALIEGRYNQFARRDGIVMSEAAKEDTRHQTLSAPVDVTLQGGEAFRLSPDWTVEVLHTPGHTWGHLVVYDPRSRTMAAGEAALWNAILDETWQPVMAPTYCYVATYLATIGRLLAMDIDTYSPAHWPLQRGADIQTFLTESRSYCLHLEAQLLNLARKNRQPFTLQEAIDVLAPSAGDWPDENDGVLAYPLLGNLDFLTQRGLLAEGENGRGVRTWRLP